MRALASIAFIVIIYIFLKMPQFFHFLKKDNCIHVFAWTNMIDEKIINQFEKESGIKVLINYYDDSSELLFKLYTTRAKGYDIVFSSDYIVSDLIKSGLLKKIDKSKLNFLNKIDSEFLGHYYDPQNEFFIPYEWAIYGIGIDKRFFGNKLPEASWNSIFSTPFDYKIEMLDEAKQAVLLASWYLFGSVDSVDEVMAEKIKALLIKQKPYVEVYRELLADYLVSSGNCPIVVAPNYLIWKTMRYDKHVTFMFPKEGSFMIIDGAILPSATKKDDLVYEFLNYIYQDNIVRYHIRKYGNLMTNMEILKQEVSKNPEMATVIPSKKYMQNIVFFKSILSKKILNQIWLGLMSR